MQENYVDSYYVHSTNSTVDCPQLTRDIKADVCIVGAGSTGLSTALHLAKQGYDVVVLEANKIGWGASSRSGGQALVDISKGAKNTAKYLGKDGARTLFDMTLEAQNIIRENCKEFKIDCHIKNGGGILAMKPRQERALLETCEEYAGYGHTIDFWDRDKTRATVASDKYIAGVYDPAVLAIHPLNYVYGLASACQSLGVRIFEGARMQTYHNDNGVFQAVTPMGTVSAKYGVFATNAYLKYREIPKIAKYIMPIASYISATEPLGKDRALSLIKNDMCICDMSFILNYYRLSKDYRMLFGGCTSYSLKSTESVVDSLNARMVDVFPQLQNVKVDYTWGGWVDITANRHPDFGWLDKNIVYAQGFSGQGIAMTNLAGRIMAEAITGKPDRLDLVSRIKHVPFVGGQYLRTPILVTAMAWYRFLDMF